MLGAFGGFAAMTFMGMPFWLAVISAIAAMAAVRRAARAGGDPPHPRPARLLHRDADHRHRLRGARRRHHDPGHRHRDAHAGRSLQERDLEAGRAGDQRRTAGGDRRHRAAVRAAVCHLPLQQGRHRDAGGLAEPAGRLLHGHSGAAPEQPGVGPGRRGGRHRRPAAGAHHLRARQHGLHRPEGLSGRGGGRLRQPAGRHRGRPDHRRGGVAVRLLPARRLQGHRRLHRGAGDAGGHAERAVRREAEEEESECPWRQLDVPTAAE